MSAGIGIALLLRFSSMLSFLYRTRSQIALFQKVARYLLKKAGKRPEGLSFDHIFRGNLTALARGASVGTVCIIPEILRRYQKRLKSPLPCKTIMVNPNKNASKKLWKHFL